jgi:hypothetical protein
MNNLYYDTIKRRRLQKTADGDTIYRYTHAEDEEESDTPIEPEVDMDYSLNGEIVSAGAGKSIVFSLTYQDEEIPIDGWSFYYFNENQNKFIKLDSNRFTLLENGDYLFRAQKGNILTENFPVKVTEI